MDKSFKGFRFKECELGVFNEKTPDSVAMLIKKDCRVMGLTRGEFSLIDLIHSILRKVGKSDVTVTTWSAGIKDANQVKWMQNNKLLNSFTIITDHSYATRQKKYAAAIDDLFGKENIRTSEIHAKFTLIKSADYYITIRTSMNLNANRTCESFEIDESKEIFDFYYSFVKTVFANNPEGFEESSEIVNKSLNLFFNKESKPKKHWSEC